MGCGHSCSSSDKFVKLGKVVCSHLCFCDAACQIYGDCCPDLYARRGYRPPAGWNLRCTQPSNGSDRTYVMEARCPENAPETLKAKCETNETSHWNFTQPVTDLNSSVTYKNRYCAECRDRHRRRYSASGSASTTQRNLGFWGPALVVKYPESIARAKTSEELYASVFTSRANQLVYNPPSSVSSSVRPCSSNAVSRCNETGLWERYDVRIEKACLRLTATTVTKTGAYKNLFCLLCNTNKSWTEILNVRDVTKNKNAEDVPLLILLNFNGDANGNDDDDEGENSDEIPRGFDESNEFHCREDDQFYDFRTMSCRSVICAHGKVAKKNKNIITCQSSFKKTNLYGYAFCLLDKEPTSSETFSEDSAFFTNELSERSTLLNLTYPIRSFTVFPSRGEAEGESKKNNAANLYVLSATFKDFRDRDAADRMLLSSLADFLNIFRTVFGNERLELAPTCSDLALPSLLPVNLNDSNVHVHAFTHPDKTLEHVYLPLSNTLTCPAVMMGLDEVDYDPNTNEIIVKRAGHDSSSSREVASHRIGLPNYIVQDPSNVLVCLGEYQRANPGNARHAKPSYGGSKYDHTLYWVGLFSSVLSLACLLVSFVVYCLVKPLRTTAGINNIVLIVALFGGQLSLLVGAEASLSGWLCQAVGVSTHFCWLAVMFAQTACTFHMFYMLSFPIAHHTTDPALLSKTYVTCVALVPLAFVVITLVWQFLGTGRSGYGGPGCYIVEPLVHVVMSAAPLLGTVSINAILFLVTLARLRARPCVASTYANRVRLLQYLKLSALTGLSWLFGALASSSGSQVLAYMFTLSQGCQGLFIFLAFLANGRVLGMLKSTLRGN